MTPNIFTPLVNWINEGVPHIVTGAGAEAVRVSADGCVIETDLRDSDSVNGSIGIRVIGARKGFKVDCTTSGFHQSSDRIIAFDPALDSNGIDITLRVSGITTKTINGYVDIGAGWTGSFRVINNTTGETITFDEGSAH